VLIFEHLEMPLAPDPTRISSEGVRGRSLRKLPASARLCVASRLRTDWHDYDLARLAFSTDRRWLLVPEGRRRANRLKRYGALRSKGSRCSRVVAQRWAIMRNAQGRLAD